MYQYFNHSNKNQIVREIKQPMQRSLSENTAMGLKVKDLKHRDIFTDISFELSGFSIAEAQVISKALVKYGGTLSTNPTFLVVPFRIQFPSASSNIITEFYIEKCIGSKSLVPLNTSVLFKPTIHDLPLNEVWVAACTGFEEFDRSWISRIVEVLGGVFTDSFSRKNTHLILNTTASGGPKALKAKEWGVDVVGIEWLDECVNAGHIVKKDESRFLSAHSIQKDNKGKLLKTKEQIVDREVSTGSLSPIPVQNQTASNRMKNIKELIVNYESDDDGHKPKRVFVEIDQIGVSAAKRPRQASYLDVVGQSERNKLLTLNAKRPKVFMFSGIPFADREKLVALIQKLGGRVLMSEVWSEECTHLIVAKVVKTEKFLTACAACVHVLKPEFISRSEAVGRWVDEDDFTVGESGFLTGNFRVCNGSSTLERIVYKERYETIQWMVRVSIC